MGIVEDFINNIKKREGLKFDSQVAKLIEVDNRQLATYKSRDSLPFKYQEWYCNRYDIEIKDFHKEIKLTNTDIQLKGEDSMDARYVIELQKDKINYQEKKITELKGLLDNKQAESTHWDALEYDFKAHIEISRENGMLGRKILSIDTLTPFMDTLGYSKEEADAIWSVGTLYPAIDDHPIDNVIDKQTKADMVKSSSSLPLIFDSLKHMIGHHYIPFACGYIAKDGSIVPSIAYNKVLWRKLEVVSKIKFLGKKGIE